MISIHDFQTKGYVVAMPNTNEGVTVNGGVTHHKQLFGQQFASSQGGLYQTYTPNIYNLDLNPGADTVFLPWYADQVASVRLPGSGSVRFFVTSNLSGCAIYIGVNNQGRVVVIHSNSQTDSSLAIMGANVPNHQTPRAVSELDLYARTAANNHGGAVRVVAVLSKTRYLNGLNRLVANGGQFLGGTTVAGWRTANTNNWQFHYQVWGSVLGAATQVHASEEFYRNF